MDILTHALSGVAFATVISGISNSKLKNQIGYVALGGFGGVLPDIDAISLWSRFDSIFGKFFGLSHSGKIIYSEKFWYSHHGFMHSFMACLLFGLILGLFIYLFQSRFKKPGLKSLYKSFKDNSLIIIAFMSGFFLHLLGDLPTPGSTWGGINLFWPLKQYVGGTGDIWWWNNYDIFLITLGIIIINLLVLFIGRLAKYKVFKITVSVFILGFVIALYQIKTRGFDFSYEGNTTKFDLYEQKSKEIQKQILGDGINECMVGFDNKVKVNF